MKTTKNMKKVLYTTICGVTLMASLGTTTNMVFASDNSSQEKIEQTSQSTDASEPSLKENNKPTESEKHTLTQTYVVYGAGTSEATRQELNKVFDVEGMKYEALTATAADYNKFINNGKDSGTPDSAMISSVAITPLEPGTGVKVNIKDFDGKNNITEITSQQYAMVAQMAGVTDILITVTANKPVSGTSALTGCYEALEKDGAKLNEKNTSSANAMLNATNGAIQENKDDEKYPGQLMSAVGQASKDIAKQKQKGKDLTKQDIKDALNEALKENGILDKTSPAQQNKIADALILFKDSPISNDKTYVKNVNNTINNVKNAVGQKMAEAKEWLNSQEAQGFFTRVKNWFVNLWHKITSFFDKDEQKQEPKQESQSEEPKQESNQESQSEEIQSSSKEEQRDKTLDSNDSQTEKNEKDVNEDNQTEESFDTTNNNHKMGATVKPGDEETSEQNNQ